jgi:transposase
MSSPLAARGILRLTEMVDTYTTSTAFARSNALFYQFLWKRGYGFSPDGGDIGVAWMLPPLLRTAHFEAIQSVTHTLEVSSGSPAWPDFFHNTEVAYALLLPSLVKTGLNYWIEDGQLRWREADSIPPATLFINSPYDPEAHLGKKRRTLWTGYKVPLTETGEPTLPHLIVHVTTTPAPRTDEAMTEAIEEELYQAAVPPGTHLVDAGYVSTRVLVNSQQRFGIEVLGPVSIDTQWQARTPSGIDASQFVLDWEHQQATCPQGKTSTRWTGVNRKRHPNLIKIQFSTTECRACPRLGDGVHSTPKYQRRTLTVRPQAQHAALQAARQRHRSETFQQAYALRAGIEATISQGVRAFDLRRSRYPGLSKTHLQHLASAAAINLVRLAAWLDGDPLAPTRVSAFERLYDAA